MFGEYIKEKRINKNISFGEFCKLMEVDASNWSKIERGLLTPPKDGEKLQKIAQLLVIQVGSVMWKEMKDLDSIDVGES